MRRFDLIRHHDVSGVSGEGKVAEGVDFGTKVAVRWCVPGVPSSVGVWDSIRDVMSVHGHNGLTEVRWIDAE